MRLADLAVGNDGRGTGTAAAGGVTIEVHVASFRSTRGYTLIGALCDEIAYWPTSEDSSEPDREIVGALRPGMATIPNALLLCASSLTRAGAHCGTRIASTSPRTAIRYWFGRPTRAR